MEYKILENYLIYEDGKIYSNKTNKFLKHDIDKDGYHQVTLYLSKCKKRFKVHRLVCWLFNGMDIYGNGVVDHIDGNKDNNHYSNLEEVTIYENNKRARENGLNNLNKEYNGRSIKCFKYKNNLYYSWEIADIFNIKHDTVLTYKSKYGKYKVATNFFDKYNIEVIK